MRVSAGILLFRRRGGELEVFLGHPGGPFWAKKDAGAWSIPKGEPADGEDLLAAAQREFQEETGCSAGGEFVPLTPIRQRGGKLVHAWAVEGDCEAESIKSNTFALEWPPRSGQQRQFPEIDRAAWLDVRAAREKIRPEQREFLDELQRLLRKS